MLIRVEQSAEKQSLIHYQETHEVAQSFGKSLAIKKKHKSTYMNHFISSKIQGYIHTKSHSAIHRSVIHNSRKEKND